MQPQVVIGMVGSLLEQGRGPDRWEHWRPTLALCQHEELLVRGSSCSTAAGTPLAESSAPTSRAVSPETEVGRARVDSPTPGISRRSTARCTTSRAPTVRAGARGLSRPHHHRHACRADLPVPAHRVAPFPGAAAADLAAGAAQGAASGSWRSIDLDLSSYDRIATRFAREQREGLSFLKSGIDTRNAAFNPLIERDRAGGGRSRAPMLLTGPDRRRQVASWRGGSSS